MEVLKGLITYLYILLNVATSISTEPCIFSCENMPNGSYPSCTSCDRFVTCQNEQFSEAACQNDLIFWGGNCSTDKDGMCSDTSENYLSTRLLSETNISETRPLCRKHSDVKLISILEVILKHPINTYTTNNTNWLDPNNICSMRQRFDLMFKDSDFHMNVFDKQEDSLESWTYLNVCKGMESARSSELIDEFYADDHTTSYMSTANNQTRSNESGNSNESSNSSNESTESGTNSHTQSEQNYEPGVEDTSDDNDMDSDSEDISPRIYHITFSCVKNYEVTFYPIYKETSFSHLVSNGTIYLQYSVDMSKPLSQRRKRSRVNRDTVNVKHLCKIQLHEEGSYYFGGPGTTFNTGRSDSADVLVINGTQSETSSYTIKPGILNNRNRAVVDAKSTMLIYRLDYIVTEDTPGTFSLPVGVLEGHSGTIEIYCGDNVPWSSSTSSTTGMLPISSRINGAVTREREDGLPLSSTTKPTNTQHIISTVGYYSTEESPAQRQQTWKKNHTTGPVSVVAAVVTTVVVVLVVLAIIAVLLYRRHRQTFTENDKSVSLTNPVYSHNVLEVNQKGHHQVHPLSEDYAKPDKAGLYKTPGGINSNKSVIIPNQLDGMVENGIYNGECPEEVSGAGEKIICGSNSGGLLSRGDHTQDMVDNAVYNVSEDVDPDRHALTDEHHYVELKSDVADTEEKIVCGSNNGGSLPRGDHTQDMVDNVVYHVNEYVDLDRHALTDVHHYVELKPDVADTEENDQVVHMVDNDVYNNGGNVFDDN